MAEAVIKVTELKKIGAWRCMINWPLMGKMFLTQSFRSIIFSAQKGYTVTSHWSDVTTGEVGSMVREAIKRGEQAIAEEAKVNGPLDKTVELWEMQNNINWVCWVAGYRTHYAPVLDFIVKFYYHSTYSKI